MRSGEGMTGRQTPQYKGIIKVTAEGGGASVTSEELQSHCYGRLKHLSISYHPPHSSLFYSVGEDPGVECGKTGFLTVGGLSVTE